MDSEVSDGGGSHKENVTRLLNDWGNGDRRALDELMAMVHRDLHQIARACMSHERAGHSLQATALVNEAYLRLAEIEHVDWQNRAHFLAMAARVMRRILVDHARSKHYQKRGGAAVRVTFDELALHGAEVTRDVAILDDALRALEEIDERKARVVEMRFFGGLTVEETASALDVSPETVMREWKRAKLWLLREMRGQSH